MRYSLVVVLMFFLATLSFGKSLDSLRTEKQNGKKFIVHRVEPKETLYGISKRYDVSVDDIVKYNEGVKGGLKMYQEILIPFKKKRKGKKLKKAPAGDTKLHIVAAGETLFAISRKYGLAIDSLVSFNDLEHFNISIGDTIYLESGKNRVASKNTRNQNADSTFSQIQVDTVQTLTHTVAASETLYAISKQYNISIDSLAKWNNLGGNNLSIGQQLVVAQSSPVQAKPDPDILPDTSDTTLIKKEVPLDTIFVKTNNKPFQETQEMTENGLLMTNEGIAMKIDQTVDTKKYLALHRTAPIGTVVEIKNQMNGVTINARVVGKLPDTGLNRNVLIRVSGAAFDKLGAIDPKIPVLTSYIRSK